MLRPLLNISKIVFVCLSLSHSASFSLLLISPTQGSFAIKTRRRCMRSVGIINTWPLASLKSLKTSSHMSACVYTFIYYDSTMILQILPSLNDVAEYQRLEIISNHETLKYPARIRATERVLVLSIRNFDPAFDLNIPSNIYFDTLQPVSIPFDSI